MRVLHEALKLLVGPLQKSELKEIFESIEYGLSEIAHRYWYSTAVLFLRKGNVRSATGC